MSGRFEVQFIGHACLKIAVGRLRLLTDPWLNGPAYARQWYQYPVPDRSVPIDDVHYIHYSHGHEDHLHQPTFSLLPKSATALLTRQWFPGNAEWLKSEGFSKVREVPSGRWIRLADPSMTDVVECVNLVNRSDSIGILVADQETLVNVNDALHCYDPSCIDHYCRRIRSLLKGRPIDYLFCGFGGASYFPSCLRHPRKDDRAVGVARERHLAQGFARVVRNLEPRMALAFASGFVLLEPFNLWINEVKLHSDPVALTEQQQPSMRGRVFNLAPGDRISVRGLSGPQRLLPPTSMLRSIRGFTPGRLPSRSAGHRCPKKRPAESCNASNPIFGSEWAGQGLAVVLLIGRFVCAIVQGRFCGSLVKTACFTPRCCLQNASTSSGIWWSKRIATSSWQVSNRAGAVTRYRSAAVVCFTCVPRRRSPTTTADNSFGWRRNCRCNRNIYACRQRGASIT